MGRILVIDNYDSFTYNIVQEASEVGASVTVVRNDEWSLSQIRDFAPEGIIISPGPGSPLVPRDIGLSDQVILQLGQTTPILGVCLGHQSIGAVFGGTIIPAPELVHGKTSMISHDGKGVFSGLPNPFEATRYHSLMVDPSSVPDVLEITANTPDGIIMGLRHKELPIEGVQFHPESILTVEGINMFSNFVSRCSGVSA